MIDGSADVRALTYWVRTRLLIVPLALSLIAAPRPSLAGQALLWQVPAGCPDVTSLRAQVDEQLGRPLVPSDQLAARITVEAEPGAYRARLEIVMGRRVFEREVSGGSCAGVTGAVALVLAMLVREAESTAPGPLPSFVSAEAPTVAAPVAPAARDRYVPSPWSAAVRAALIADAGALPGAAGGAGAAVAFGWNGWRAELYGAGWLARRARLDPASSAGADVSLLVTGLRGCVQRARRLLCAEAEMGRLSGSAVGVSDPRRASLPWTAAGLAVAFPSRLGAHLDGLLMVEGLAPLQRPRFVLDDGAILYQPAPLTLRVSLAVQIGRAP
jgi:hypothetical protein